VFTFNLYGADQETKETLQDIVSKLNALLAQGKIIMAQNAELKAFLDSLNVYTNEIAADIDELLARVSAGNTLSPEDLAALTAHSDTLKAIAAKSGEPLPPPVEPPPVA
jgi:methyl-accepting chemotaxis protein